MLTVHDCAIPTAGVERVLTTSALYRPLCEARRPKSTKATLGSSAIDGGVMAVAARASIFSIVVDRKPPRASSTTAALKTKWRLFPLGRSTTGGSAISPVRASMCPLIVDDGVARAKDRPRGPA